MFDFAEATKDMAPIEILNYYRNLYYAEPQVTERGIVANAINDVIADVVPRSEVARELKAFEEKVGRIYNHYVFEDTDYAEDDVAIEAVINALTEVLNDLSDLCQKYTEGEK
jgi:hypothetical protein